jgi:hypothetical protein
MKGYIEVKERQYRGEEKRWKNNERGEEFIPRELIYW